MTKTPQDIIIKPVITERAMDILQEKKYTFRVLKSANKIEIAKAVEKLFGVDVEKVRTMNCKGRYVRQGATGGYRPDYKKAIVTLTKDSKTIEFFEGMY